MKGFFSGIFYAIAFIILLAFCSKVISGDDGYCDSVTQHVDDQSWYEMCKD